MCWTGGARGGWGGEGGVGGRPARGGGGADSLWQVKAYRLAMFLADLGWPDVTKLMSDRRTIGLADQLYRSLGSIGADIAEGYSRGTGGDRGRFYGNAVGVARESRDWYYKGRHILGETITLHRLDLLAG